MTPVPFPTLAKTGIEIYIRDMVFTWIMVRRQPDPALTKIKIDSNGLGTLWHTTSQNDPFPD